LESFKASLKFEENPGDFLEKELLGQASPDFSGVL
jgi:hypothetical protein